MIDNNPLVKYLVGTDKTVRTNERGEMFRILRRIGRRLRFNGAGRSPNRRVWSPDELEQWAIKAKTGDDSQFLRILDLSMAQQLPLFPDEIFIWERPQTTQQVKQPEDF